MANIDLKAGPKKNKRVLYVGSDVGFWTNVKYRIKSTYEHIVLEFKEIPSFSDDDINTKILEVLEYSPDFIYLDMSSNFETFQKFCLYIKRLHPFKNKAIVGLIEEESKIEDTIYAGLDFVFIKGAEMHDVVYHPYFYGFPTEAIKKDFALARFKQDASIIENFRVGYFGVNSFHIESNATWNVGDDVHLETNIRPEYCKSKSFKVAKKSSRGMYYNYKYNFDLEYKYLDDLKFDDSALDDAMEIADHMVRQKTILKIEEERKQRIAEHEQTKEKSKKELKMWVESLQDSKEQKSTKILIIDDQLGLLENETRKLDSFPYTVRLQTNFSKDFLQIEKYLPQLIVFKIPEIDFGVAEDSLSDVQKQHMIKKAETKFTEYFGKLIDKSKKIKGYMPFIIIFNCQTFTSKAFQDTFRYDLIITNTDGINFNLVLQMAELFEKKQQATIDAQIEKKILDLRTEDPVKYGRLKKSDFVEAKYFVSKYNKLSRGSFSHDIELKAISESEVFFLTDKELALTNYYLETPFKMAIHLVPQEGNIAVKDQNQLLYKGLIHGIGEREKKKLRQFVNEIYTAHKLEEREKEKEAFENMKKQKEENEKTLEERKGDGSESDSDSGEE